MIPDENATTTHHAPIDGLKLLIRGDELCRLLDDRSTRIGGEPIGGNRNRLEHQKNRQKTTRCSRVTSASTTQSDTNGARTCSTSFVTTSIRPAATPWGSAIWRLASCSRRSLAGLSRRSTKSAPPAAPEAQTS
jgi:hypothetical protein